MNKIVPREVQQGTRVVKVGEFRAPSNGAAWESGATLITVELTCERGNSLHAGVHNGIMYYWVDRETPLTDSDLDRWAALTGTYPLT